MKGLKKSVLMGAALALLLGAVQAAATEAAVTELAAEESEATEAWTETNQEEAAGTEEAGTEEAVTEAAAAETGPTEAAATEEEATEAAAAETGPTEAAVKEEAATEEETTEAAGTEASREELTEAGQEAVPAAVQSKGSAQLDASYLTVTWMRVKEGEPTLVYTQREDDHAISAIDGGIWDLEIQVDFQANGKPLTDGSYFCKLVWPAGDEVLLPGGASGFILINGVSGVGTWELSEGGDLKLELENIDSLADVTGWISTSVMVGKEESEVPGVRPDRPAIEKEGLYDAAAQRVFWTAEVTVPAWDGGMVSSWSVHDIERTTPASWSESFKNEYAQMTVDGAPDGTAWLYEEEADGSALIWFLNPCTCDTDPCEGGRESGQRGGRPCGHTKYTDAAGQDWCTCWHQKKNSTFILSYSADTAQLQQQMQECGEKEVQLINDAVLLQNGEWAGKSLAHVEVHQAIKKAEDEAPKPDNDYNSTCTITVNSSFDDYSRASCIEVTDRMENLTYLNDSIAITCLYRDGTQAELRQISGQEAAALGREGNENRFFSIETSDAEDCFCVSLWYPTQASYILTYKAAVTELVPGGMTNYQNTASLGKVSSTVKGKGFRVDDAWFGKTFEATVLKIDARSSEEDPAGLAGAVFEVRQVNEEGEDLLVDTLTTGEDGTDVFRTKRGEGILVSSNTLYYLQESVPPKGYEKNEEKYYFYFSPGDDMVLPEGITAVKGEKQEETGVLMYKLTLVVPDEPEKPKEMPATGGPGEALFFLLGLALLAASRKTVLPV